MRSNNQTNGQIRQSIKRISAITKKGKNFLTLGIEVKQWLASLLICLMLLPLFALPAGAYGESGNNQNSGEFAPVNEQLSVWTEGWRNLNAKVESWTTLRRAENAFYNDNVDNDKKKNEDKKDISVKSEERSKKNLNDENNKADANFSNKSTILIDKKSTDLAKSVKKIKTSLPENIIIQAQQSINLTALPLDRLGNVVNGVDVFWQSSDTEVLKIQNQRALAVKEGVAKLTVRSGNNSKTFGVKIVASSQSPSSSTSFDRSDDETRYFFTPQNNLGKPFGQVEAQAPNAASASRRLLERPGSSNFSFDVPVAGLPGRGINAGIGLSYNSRVWNLHTTRLDNSYFKYNTDQNWLAPGFTFGLGKVERLDYYNYAFTAPDGTRHQFFYVSGGIYSRTYETADGTFMKLVINTTNNGVTTSGVLRYSDGSIFYLSPLTEYKLFPTQITDRNGNFIQIAYRQNDTEGRIWYIKDTLNRYINFYYDNSNRLVTVTVPGYNNSGERQTIRFYYDTLNFDPTVSRFNNIVANIPSTVQVLKYVYFPGTQTGYKYEYSPSYGMIYKISNLRGMLVDSVLTTETGSVISEGQIAASTTYNYPLNIPSPLPNDVPYYTTRTDDWAGRTSAQAITTYQVEKYTVNNVTKAKITSPDGTITETWSKIAPDQWNDGLVSDIFTKTLINPQLQTYKIWSHTKLFWGNQINTNGRQNPRVEKIEVTNEADQTITTTLQFDNYNNPIVVRQHDFAAPGQTGTELERTEITYENNSNWLNRGFVHLPTIVKKIVNNTIVNRTDYEYDNYGAYETDMLPRNDIIMFDQSYNPSSPSYNSSTKYRGNITKVTAFSNAALTSDPDASVTTTKYDIAGNEVETVANCCVKVAWGYSKSTEYAYLTNEARGLNGELTTSAIYDFNTGLTKTMTDENNQTSTSTYDPNNLRRTRSDAPDGGYSTFEYHDDLVNGPNGSKWSYIKSTVKLDATKTVSNWNYLDGRGAVVRSLGPQFNGEHQGVSDIQYDVMGRVAKVSNPYTTTSFSNPVNPSNNWTVPTYDPLDRITLVNSPDNNAVLREYNGTVATITDQAGKKRRQISNALGNVIRTDEPDTNDNLGDVNSPNQPTYFDYDGNDNLIKVTQTGSGITQERAFRYDSLSRLTHEKQVEASQTLDDNGVKIPTAGQWTGVYKYNLSGLLIEGTNARGVKGSFTYDTLNRIKTVNFTGETGYQTPNITYTYDEERPGYFNKGQLTKIETAQIGTDIPATAQILDYDLMGRVKKQSQSLGANSYTLEYGYNLAGQLISEKYPSGRTVNLEVDTIGRTSAIFDAQRTYASNLQYSSYGEISSINLGNGTVENYGYNPLRLQLTSQNLTKGTEVIQKYEYGYGKVDLATGNLDATKNNGQLARIDSYIGGTVSNPTKQWQQRFDYDELGRLREVREHRGDTNALSYKYIFDFDRFGNLFRKQTSNPTAGQENPLPYQPIENGDINKTTNHFSSSTGTQYDESGNVTRDTKFRNRDYKYDANGRMIWSKLVNNTGYDATSIYDASGNRVATKVDDIWRVFVYDISGSIVAEYGGLTPSDEGGVKYILQDGQGSTRAILNQSGFVQARFDYQAFGEEINSNVGLRTMEQRYGSIQPVKNKFALTEKDEATGLDHTDWRKFDNQAGRWTSPDPYTGSMSTLTPQSFNRYSYVNNDPINSVDPSGLVPCFQWVTRIHFGREATHVWLEAWLFECSSGPKASGTGGGGNAGGQQKKKECPLKKDEITDPEAKRIESFKGNYFDKENLTQATRDALECLKNLVNPELNEAWNAGNIEGAASSVMNGNYRGRSFLQQSGYRPPAYQDHLRNIHDLLKDSRINSKECSALKNDLLNEKKMHSLSDTVGKTSRHSSGTGFDLSITGVGKKGEIDKLANQCGLERLYDNKGKLLKGEESHFQLK
jgi:RHS repeat-associated protein